MIKSLTRLPGLECFFGQERGMHKLADYAKPRFEELLIKQRSEAVNTINRIKSDIQDQYKEELKDSRKKITVETTGAFLNALTANSAYNFDKNRGLMDGILVHDRDTGIPLHVLRKQNLLFKNNTTNELMKKTTKDVIGKSFEGAISHRAYRLRKERTVASIQNPHNKQFPIYRGSDNPDVNDLLLVSSRVSFRVGLFYCPDLDN